MPPAVDPQATRAAAAELMRWFRGAARDLPWRTDFAAARAGHPGGGGLVAEPPADGHRRDPYRTWIAEIMLQQTQVATVIAYYDRWMLRFPDLASLAAAAEDEVLSHWAGLGYYSRARNILATAKAVVEAHGGAFPRSRAGLMGLKGIGEYTAGAIASLAWNLPEPILDGNLVRVFSRLYGLPFLPNTAEGKRAYWELAKAWVEAGEPALVNEGLMELGALVCTPRGPDCGACPLSARCRAKSDGTQEDFPPAKKRKGPEDIRGYALILRRGRQVLLARPRKGELLAGLPTFPMLPLAQGPAIPALKAAWRGTYPAVPVPAFRPRAVTVTHTITHHRIALDLAEAELGEAPAQGWPEGWEWVDAARVGEALVSAFSRKIWEASLHRAGRTAKAGTNAAAA